MSEEVGSTAAQAENVRVIPVASEAPMALPADDALLMADFSRDGDDLVLTAPDGSITVLKGYFVDGPGPDLIIGGAVLQGATVAKLAQTAVDAPAPTATAQTLETPPTTDAPVQTVATGPAPAGGDLGARLFGAEGAVAAVAEVHGSAYIQRKDGSRDKAEPGAAIFEDDVLITADGASMGVTFVDGMTFSLGEQARMVLDEFDYDPAAEEGGGVLSILQGAFSFVSGEAAHTAEDALMIHTPTMTIGVRGTKVVSEINAEGQASRIALLAEEDGRVGKIMVITEAGEELIETPNHVVEVVSRFEPPSAPRELSSAEAAQYFGDALSALPPPTTLFRQDIVEAGFQFGAEMRAAQGLSPSPRGESSAPAQVEAATPEPAAEVDTPASTEEKPRASAAERLQEAAATAAEKATTAEAASAATETKPTEVASEATAARVAEVLEDIFEATTTLEAIPTEEVVAAPVSVNAAPTSVGARAANLQEDASFSADVSYLFSDEDADTLTYTISIPGGDAAPGWISIDGATGILTGTPGQDDVGSAVIVVTATDAYGAAASSAITFSIAGVNDAPELYGADATTLSQVTEDATAHAGDTVASLFGSVLVADVDVGADGSAEQAIAVTGVDTSNGFWEYAADGSTFVAFGAVSDSSAVLLDASARVRFTPNEDYTGSASLSFRAWDKSSGANGDVDVDATTNGGSSAFSAQTATASVTIAAANDAPVLTTAADPVLSAITEDAPATSGDAVGAFLVEGSISDVDGAAAQAIAVTGVDNTNGAWEYSTDGATFIAFGPVSDSEAVLLDASARIRFTPNEDFAGASTFTYRAWDMSSGASGQTAVDVSNNGGTTAFSSAVETASIQVTNVNDAPVIDVSHVLTFTDVAQDDASPVGDLVADLLHGSAISDVDGAVSAIALTDAPSSNGSWEYSLDGGQNFTSVPAVNETSALLLDGSAMLRFIPDAGYSGGADISFRAWDKTSGVNGQAGVDTTSNGGATAFSTAIETATLSVVTTPNAAPVLNSGTTWNIPVFAEGDQDNPGATVSQFVVDGAITDADSLAVEAIAVTSVDETNGTWQYSIDGGANFVNFNAVAEDNSVLLDSMAVIRFVPDADYNGAASFTYRAWDRSFGANGDVGVDTTTNGGTTAFSMVEESAFVTISPVNDAPELDIARDPRFATVSEDSAPGAGDNVATLVSDGSITDPEGVVEAIAVTFVDDANGVWEFSVDGVSGWTSLSGVSDTNATLLDQNARIRFTPNENYNGSATLNYRAWDQSDGRSSGDTGVDVSTNGGASAFSSTAEVATIDVLAVNDAPVLDTSGSPVLTAISENQMASAGDAISDIVVDGSISDADGAAAEAIAVTGVDTSNGTWQYAADGVTYVDFPAVSDSSAVLLDASAKIRFVPNADFDGDASFTYRAWDGSAGASGDTNVDVSVNGGATAFSSAVETASITVTSANNAPTIVSAGALEFSKSNDYATAGDSGANGRDLDIGTGDYTVELWFYYDGETDRQVLVANTDDSRLADGFEIGLHDGYLYTFVNAGDFNHAVSKVEVTEHGWHHVAMVIDQEAGWGDSTVTGYLNGSNDGWQNTWYMLAGDNDFTQADISSGYEFVIGAIDGDLSGNSYKDSYEGQISDVRVWSAARTSEEINADMARVLDGSETGLVANWRFDDGSGDTAQNTVAGGAEVDVKKNDQFVDGSAIVDLKDDETVQGRVAASDVDGDALVFSLLSQGSKGVASINASTGVWEYTSDHHESGLDTVSYQVTDSSGATDTVTITFDIS